MKLSEQTDKLLPALAIIQGEIEVKKKANNPFHKSKYADIETIVSACVPELKANGLMFIQTLDDENTQPGQVLIITRIYHVESGQWVESRLKMDGKASGPQDLGSAITYGRRYSLVTTLGLTPEDDDANKAQGLVKDEAKQQPKKQYPKPQAAQPTRQTGKPTSTVGPTEQEKNAALVNANKILALQTQYGLSQDEVLLFGEIESIKLLVEEGQATRLGEAYQKLADHIRRQKAS